MKKNAYFLLIGLLFILPLNAIAQYSISVDSTYGTKGKTEIDFGVSIDPSGYDINRFTKIVGVCGAILKANNNFEVGMIRLDSGGKADNTFGTNGTAHFSWSTSDYPTSMVRHGDNDSIYARMYILGGASAHSEIAGDYDPAIFRITTDGIADVTFGTNGRLVIPFNNFSGGEVTDVYSYFGTHTYYVYGQSKARTAEGKTGFAIMRLHWNGTPDSTFGVNGIALMPVDVHSVHGFFSFHGTVPGVNYSLMCGVSDNTKEILIARFDDNGQPYQAAGNNGLVHTGVFVTGGDTVISALTSEKQGSDKVLALLPSPKVSPTPLTICRFDSLGRLDPTYGNNGTAQNLISPSIDPKGFNILNDGSAAVSGAVHEGLGHSIFARLNDTTAIPDPQYFPNGVAIFDLGGGQYSNYLKHYEPIGQNSEGTGKRYIAVGVSVRNGINNLMVARFNSFPVSRVNDVDITNPSIEIFPDPVSSVFKIHTPESIKQIRITDELGREVLSMSAKDFSSDSQTYSLDASHLTKGIYYCIIETGSKHISKKFIVSH
jgi:uncharacterized delta-60 repeat protein